MNSVEYAKMWELEKFYWWYVARRRLINLFISRYLPDSIFQGTCMDVGCGTGVVLQEIGSRFSSAVGIDMSSIALKLTRERQQTALIEAKAEHIPVKDNQFDLVLCLDVIEHTRYDLAAMAELNRICKPGGYVMISVPALDFLWSEHDEALYHFRRYSKRTLERRLRSQGFTIVKTSYAVFSIFWFIFLVRLWKAFRRDSLVASTMLPKPPAWINRLLIFVHDIENAVSRYIPLPLGTGLVCLVRKETTQ